MPPNVSARAYGQNSNWIEMLIQSEIDPKSRCFGHGRTSWCLMNKFTVNLLPNAKQLVRQYLAPLSDVRLVALTRWYEHTMYHGVRTGRVLACTHWQFYSSLAVSLVVHLSSHLASVCFERPFAYLSSVQLWTNHQLYHFHFSASMAVQAGP